jgi:hypothetical protein
VLLLCFNLIGIASAATTIQVTAGLGSTEVNAVTLLSFHGMMYGDNGGVPAKIQAGDCFVVTRP